jgi:hypothetical protein
MRVFLLLLGAFVLLNVATLLWWSGVCARFKQEYTDSELDAIASGLSPTSNRCQPRHLVPTMMIAGGHEFIQAADVKA